MIEWLQDKFSPGPLFGWVCAAFAVLIPVIWWCALLRRGHPTLWFSAPTSLNVLQSAWRRRARYVLPLLRTLAVAALIVALARPQSGGAYREYGEGIAIQMVLDVSGSMAEEDFVINNAPVRRLDAVKQVFEDFVLGKGGLRGRGGDLIGMTTFAMYADAPCPLTLDHGSLVDLLRETDIPGWVNGRQVRQHPEAGFTSLGDAIALATDDLRRAGEQAVAGVRGAESARSRVMVLLTDGKNNPPERDPGESASPDPIEAARVAATLGIKVYTIGAVGSAQARRTFSGIFQRPRAEVDEPQLKAIAAMTGGKYFRATDTESLSSIYEEIDKLERHRTGERSYHDNVRASTYAMLTALTLLMTELLLAQTRWRRVP